MIRGRSSCGLSDIDKDKYVFVRLEQKKLKRRSLQVTEMLLFVYLALAVCAALVA